VIPDAEGNLKTITANTDKKTVFEYVKEHSANLDKYNYREWDQDTVDYVNRVIVATTGETNISSNFAGAVNGAKTEDGLGAKVEAPGTSGIKSEDISLDGLGGDSEGGLGDLDLPSLESSEGTDIGIGGDLEDALKDL
jgi:hypothetical protein